MVDPIDRQDAIYMLKTASINLGGRGGGHMAFAKAYNATITAIENLPTIDAVPVVRCADCKRWNTLLDREVVEYGVCQRWSHPVVTSRNDFCSRGEKRTDETD